MAKVKKIVVLISLDSGDTLRRNFTEKMVDFKNAPIEELLTQASEVVNKFKEEVSKNLGNVQEGLFETPTPPETTVEPPTV